MNEDLLTPGVPSLSDEWIAQRTQHLIEEVTSPSPRRRRRLVIGSAGGGAVAISAVLIGLLGPWATPAFAGWSEQPTTPTSGQLTAAEATCATLATNLASQPGSTQSPTLAPLALSDVRGPYSLLVYGTTNPALCVVGDTLASLDEDGASIGMSSGPQSPGGNTVVHQSTTSQFTNPAPATVPGPGGAVVEIDNATVRNGDSFSVSEGAVGSDVTGATLELSDGTSVVATVVNGLFAAWWPTSATVTSIQVTTTSGVN